MNKASFKGAFASYSAFASIHRMVLNPIFTFNVGTHCTAGFPIKGFAGGCLQPATLQGFRRSLHPLYVRLSVQVDPPLPHFVLLMVT